MDANGNGVAGIIVRSLGQGVAGGDGVREWAARVGTGHLSGAEDCRAFALLARPLLGAVELLEHSQLLLHLAGRLVHAARAGLILRSPAQHSYS